jgi:hypothetical protein
MLSNQCVEVDGCRPASMIESMSNKNPDDITNAELAKLIESVAVNLVSLQEKVTAFQENVEQRFENVEERFDKIEGRLDRAEEAVVTKTYLDIRLEKIQAGAFTPDEKKSVLDTVKLINDRWGEDETGTKHITLTREEYEAASRVQGFPNRFVGIPLIDIE